MKVYSKHLKLTIYGYQIDFHNRENSPTRIFEYVTLEPDCSFSTSLGLPVEVAHGPDNHDDVDELIKAVLRSTVQAAQNIDFSSVFYISLTLKIDSY